MTTQLTPGSSFANFDIAVQIDDPYTSFIEEDSLAAAIAETLRQAGWSSGGVTLVITGDDEVQQLNLTYRGVDAPTDVLSFPSREETSAARPDITLPPELAAELDAYLGDVIIAFAYTERQAKHYQNPLLSELRLLAVHGTLHLLGYDHDTPARQATMWALQDAVLAVFGEQSPSQRNYEL